MFLYSCIYIFTTLLHNIIITVYYNNLCSINGIPACANKQLLTDILRSEWGFKGYVISDQGAVGENCNIIIIIIDSNQKNFANIQRT